MGVRVDTSEMRALSKNLGEVGPKVGAKAAQAFRKTVHDIEADAKTAAPVDTGALMNSISTDITDGRFGSMSADIGPTVDYAIYVHEGTSKMAGRPFLTDAYDRRVPGFETALERLAGDVL